MQSARHVCVFSSRCLLSIERSHVLPSRQFTSSTVVRREYYPADNFPGFAADAMDVPLRYVQPLTKTPPTPPPAEALPKTEEEEQIAKARIVFGSRLAGPGERRREIENASTVVAGVHVPPKPEEPDNCCMSGCVNCVWDQFRDEVEEWAAKSAEARAKLLEQRKRSREAGSNLAEPGMPGHIASSMDEDGGGSEGLWTGADLQAETPDLFADIPVGIREFMKTEKKLKARHHKTKTLSG